MEPERRIEKWLRAFAKKRREQAGAPMEMRPAMRQQLQREIARQAEKPNRGGFLSFFSGLRLRVAFAVCFLALAAGTWFLVPQLTREQPATLTMNNLGAQQTKSDDSARVMTPPSVVPAPATLHDKKVPEEKQTSAAPALQPAAPTVAAANREPIPLRPETTKQIDRTQKPTAQHEVSVNTAAASAPPGGVPSTNTLLAFKNETAADSLAVSGALNKDTEGALPAVDMPAATNFVSGSSTFAANQKTLRSGLTPQTPIAPGSTSVIYDARKTALATAVPSASQMFNRTTATRQRAAGTSGTAAPVLVSFRVEQSGNNLKVVDADGSVYTGALQTAEQAIPAGNPAALAPKNAPATAKTPPINGTAQSVAPQYFFRVAGTNRNLNQNVVFSGNFVPLTNSQVAANANRASDGATGSRSGGGFGGRGGPVGPAARVGGFGGSPAAGLLFETPLANSSINGTIVIGNSKAVNVIATPAQ